MLVLGKLANVNLLGNLESVVCVPVLVTFSPDQLKDRKRTFQSFCEE